MGFSQHLQGRGDCPCNASPQRANANHVDTASSPTLYPNTPGVSGPCMTPRTADKNGRRCTTA
jgi:hypothetical protein